MKTKSLVILALFFSIFSSLNGQALYVSPDGNDANPGTLELPFKTFNRSVEAIKEAGGKGQVLFRDGIYPFTKTAILNKENCGGGITFQAFPGERPIFTSGIHITNWKKIRSNDPAYRFLPRKARNRVFVAPIPKGLGLVRHLVDRDADWLELGKINVTDWVTTEKWKHGNSVEGQMWDPPDEKTICTFSYSLENFSNTDSALMFTIYTADFELLILPVARIDGQTLITATPGGHRLALPEKGQRHDSQDLAFIHNLVEGITGPGKWACYPESGQLYLWPLQSTAQIFTPSLKEIIRIEGVPKGREAWFAAKSADPPRNIIFDGITFTNCDQAVWENEDASMQHDWGLIDKENALLRFRGAEKCIVRNCTFQKSGSAGIAFDLHAKYNLVENCLFEYLGFEAVRFAGYGIGTMDQNNNNIFRNNEIKKVCEIHHYGAAIILWNSGFNTIANNYLHHFGSRAVLLSAPRSRAFTKNNQPNFPKDRIMQEQAWPMARWFEIPDSALSTVHINRRGNVSFRDAMVGLGDTQLTGLVRDRRCSHFRYSRGNVIEHNVICDGAEKLFGDAIFYITATASGNPNRISENYICNTGTVLSKPNIPFRLIYIDGYSGDFEFNRNVVYRSQFRFEAVAPYAWWGKVDYHGNIFYYVKAGEGEFFGEGNRSLQGNLCIGYGPSDPRKEYLDDYQDILDLLESDQLSGPKPLPGKKELQTELRKILDRF